MLCYFKPLNLGVACYAAITNQYRDSARATPLLPDSRPSHQPLFLEHCPCLSLLPHLFGPSMAFLIPSEVRASWCTSQSPQVSSQHVTLLAYSKDL